MPVGHAQASVGCHTLTKSASCHLPHMPYAAGHAQASVVCRTLIRIAICHLSHVCACPFMPCRPKPTSDWDMAEPTPALGSRWDATPGLGGGLGSGATPAWGGATPSWGGCDCLIFSFFFHVGVIAFEVTVVGVGTWVEPCILGRPWQQGPQKCSLPAAAARPRELAVGSPFHALKVSSRSQMPRLLP